MNYDDVAKLAETMTPKEMARHLAEKFKDRPQGLLHAHGLAEKVERTKKANSRGPELRAKVAEILEQNPNLSLHEAYRRAGSLLGIL